MAKLYMGAIIGRNWTNVLERPVEFRFEPGNAYIEPYVLIVGDYMKGAIKISDLSDKDKKALRQLLVAERPTNQSGGSF